jgi:hypothetical protein
MDSPSLTLPPAAQPIPLLGSRDHWPSSSGQSLSRFDTPGSSVRSIDLKKGPDPTDRAVTYLPTGDNLITAKILETLLIRLGKSDAVSTDPLDDSDSPDRSFSMDQKVSYPVDKVVEDDAELDPSNHDYPPTPKQEKPIDTRSCWAEVSATVSQIPAVFTEIYLDSSRLLGMSTVCPNCGGRDRTGSGHRE